MRAADVLTASIIIIFSGLVLVDATRLGFGWGTDGPQSGFFPFILALLMIVCCSIIIGQAARKTSRQTFVSLENFRPVLKVLWPATAALGLMQWLGLYVASALYLGFYMRWVGRHSWGAVVALSLGMPIVTFYVFEKWFLVPMPKGPLETWLGY
jgi:putative tricarboxylic transport membrane protein